MIRTVPRVGFFLQFHITIESLQLCRRDDKRLLGLVVLDLRYRISDDPAEVT
jgi:hypothetical protein